MMRAGEMPAITTRKRAYTVKKPEAMKQFATFHATISAK
jgi:hypothetical protein